MSPRRIRAAVKMCFMEDEREEFIKQKVTEDTKEFFRDIC
jgi:hypothetical protein